MATDLATLLNHAVKMYVTDTLQQRGVIMASEVQRKAYQHVQQQHSLLIQVLRKAPQNLARDRQIAAQMLLCLMPERKLRRKLVGEYVRAVKHRANLERVAVMPPELGPARDGKLVHLYKAARSIIHKGKRCYVLPGAYQHIGQYIIENGMAGKLEEVWSFAAEHTELRPVMAWLAIKEAVQ